jgi:glycosyltransferase involved in cell wall biosynthesis
MTMKILQIHYRYDAFGGGERYLLDSSQALEELGHQVVITSSKGQQPVRFPHRQEYFVQDGWGLRSGLKTLKIYSDILARENPDIVQIHTTWFFLSPLVVQTVLLRRKPTVLFVHHIQSICFAGTKIIPMLDRTCARPLSWRCLRQGCVPSISPELGRLLRVRVALIILWERAVAKRLDRVIVGSQYMRQELLRNGFAPEKVNVIPLYTEKRPTSDGPFGGDAILYVGRIDRFKGLPQLIKALSLLRSQWKADIIGDGPYLQEAKLLTKTLQLESRIRFLGSLPFEALDEHYQRCAMVVMPSMIQESFGFVGIEAMAFAKPVIAFDVGGVREWLVDGETGFLVPRGDFAGLAERMEQLLRDQHLAKQLGQAGQVRVDGCFRKDAHLQRLVTLYQEVIDSRKARDPFPQRHLL